MPDLFGRLTDLGRERWRANPLQADYTVLVDVMTVRRQGEIEPSWNINTDILQKLVAIVQ